MNINKTIFSALFASMLCFSSNMFAQYDDIRFPQSKEQCALLKKLNVLGQTDYTTKNGQRLAAVGKAYNDEGQIIAHIEYNHKRYYLYDANGRVTAHLDSTLTPYDTYIVSEYRFIYDDAGNLVSAKLPGSTSTFTHDPTRHVITERVNTHDTILIRVYTFNAQNKPLEIKSIDVAHQTVETHHWLYAESGLVVNESNAFISPELRDSSFIVYGYNDKKQIFERDAYHFKTMYVYDVVGAKPTHSAEQYSADVYLYTYDDQGRVSSEEHKNKQNRLSDYFRTTKYNENGLIKTYSERVAKTEPRFFNCEYVYRK